MLKIDRIDHFVLTVSSLEATCDFYTRVLGMQRLSFNDGRLALRFGQQKINLHEAGNEFSPRAQTALPGTADFCLITSQPIEEVIEHVKNAGASIELGPVERTGAMGELASVYLRDPDNNLVEISNCVH